MIEESVIDDHGKCLLPWKYTRLEVQGRMFLDNKPSAFPMDDFKRPTEPFRFSLLGVWHCQYQSGPNLVALAGHCAAITGRNGFYGLVKGTRVPS